ncbi:MAG: HU family DNA-binding protein [Mycoplasmataceae bacterium]|jgi:nucleoid DNA-binding protein|nr:HU family DNA-binding protein [Mycoplasmataceae bacterium]
MKKLTYSGLIDKLYRDNEYSLPKKKIKLLLEQISKSMVDELNNNQTSIVLDLGTLTVYKTKQKKFINPKTKQESIVSPSQKIVFKPYGKLKTKTGKK